MWSSLAYGARLATVEEGGADVYESPSPSSKVIEKLPAKTNIPASNLPTRGFHKVRTPSGEIGWVQVNSLALQPPPTDEELVAGGAPDPKEEARDLEEERRQQRLAEQPGYIRQNIRFRALGDVNLYTASGIVSNFNGISQGLSFGGDVALMLSPRVGLAARVESLFQTIALTDSNTLKSFQVSLNSLPIMAGFDFIVIQGPRASIHLGTYLGMGFQTGLKSTDLSDSPPPPNVAEIVTSSFTALEKVDLNWQFSRHFAAFLEAGYRYLATSTLVPPSNNKGALILNSSFNVNLSGPVIGFGIGANF